MSWINCAMLGMQCFVSEAVDLGVIVFVLIVKWAFATESTAKCLGSHVIQRQVPNHGRLVGTSPPSTRMTTLGNIESSRPQNRSPHLEQRVGGIPMDLSSCSFELVLSNTAILNTVVRYLPWRADHPAGTWRLPRCCR